MLTIKFYRGPKTNTIFQETVNSNQPEFLTASEVQAPASEASAASTASESVASGSGPNPTGDELIAEALKAANITTGLIPAPEPPKPRQARKTRVLRPLL